MANIKELSDKNPDGTRLGQSAADLIGFHGAAPSDQRAITTIATAATVATAVLAIQELMLLLREKGLMADS